MKSTESENEPKSRPSHTDGALSASVETIGPETVRCNHCGLEAEPAGNRQHCRGCGCWLQANTGALVHGGRRLQLGQGTPLDETRRVELRDAVLSDLGGREECSAALAELVEDFAAAVVLRDVAYAHIAAVGPLTRAGRRRAVCDLYFQASARAERLASQIGTARKPARVPSLQEYIASRAEPTGERDDDTSTDATA